MESKRIFIAPITDAIIPSGVVDRPSVCGAFIFTTMKLIKLTLGKFVMVDDADYDYLLQFKWYAKTFKTAHTYYAATNVKTDKNKQKTLLLHRIVMNTPKGTQVDHIDHNGLNCQKHNLRNCTLRQNSMNQKCHSKSGYKGVYMNNKGILGQINVNGRKIHLGLFTSYIAAARAYDEAAKKYFGEFANLNFK
jgi:hypothetical protein